MESEVETLCMAKEQELLDRYFGKLAKEAAVDRPEDIGQYTRDLPAKIAEEYRQYLADLWKEYSAEPLVLEEQKLRWMMTEADRRALDQAYDDARTVTLWERITHTNHQDVTYYKGLLLEYTRSLLQIMRLDFLEEITGHPLSHKALE